MHATKTLRNEIELRMPVDSWIVLASSIPSRSRFNGLVKRLRKLSGGYMVDCPSAELAHESISLLQALYDFYEASDAPADDADERG